MSALEHPTSARVLLVDDVPANLDVLVRLLEPEGYQVLAASSGEDALRVATSAIPELVLLDVLMPPPDGFTVCRRLKENPATRAIPVVFITGQDDAAGVVRGFGVGGVDYISKPFHAEEVLARVRTHVAIHRLTLRLEAQTEDLVRANRDLRREMAKRREVEQALEAADERLSLWSDEEKARWGIEGFVGRSKTVSEIVESVRRVQGFSGTSVLVTGESGTGKELIARAIHAGSARAAHPFVPVNCSAVPRELAESLFFGHRRGAFTGADRARKGYFELAHRGTLFLDEVGDMPMALQAKLLRTLEDGEFTSVGADRPQKADVRIVAATNAKLDERIANGEFREDLYYRLARFTVKTPPLRERAEDIPLLAEHFVRVLSREMSRPPPRLSPDAVAALRAHPFPGNVRELKNVLERALIESGGEEIRPGHLRLQGPSTTTRPPLHAPAAAASVVDALPLNLEAAERALIERALSESRGNVAQAARMLGVPRMRIYRRLGTSARSEEPRE